MTQAKPDCTGQKFGMLTVLGKGDRSTYKKSRGKESYRYLWRLRCDCGVEIQLPRGYFDRKSSGQVSCGCKRKNMLVDNNRRPVDITGRVFGNLTAIALTGKKNSSGKPTWLMRCDCGRDREISLSEAGRAVKKAYKLHCGNEIHGNRLWYPPTPNPYPDDAGEILAKYLPLTKLRYSQIDSRVENYKIDKLIRAAWIITYRKRQGENISELYEQRFISKHLRYCSIHIFWQRKIEMNGGILYDVGNNKREIGVAVANLTSQSYPEIETQGITMLPANPNSKHLRFSRC